MDSLKSYQLGRCISRAHSSQVSEATYLETGAVVAIKKVNVSNMDASSRKECDTEITMLQMLDHPNLIKYHTHFNHEGDLHLVMELAAGGTLANKIENCRKNKESLDEHLIWRWICDVASALAYLHKQRVLHRDIKPSHIFIGDTGQAKLGDFGLSKAMSEATQCAMSCVGTPLYMSPEIVRGEGYAYGSDIWSLGCALYELAAGFPPFFRTDMDFVALGYAICSAEYPALSSDHYSKDFIDVISQILTVDAAQRPTAQRILDLASCKLVGRIQDFQIIGTLGRGKFSEVHRALWKAGGDREVALKRVQIYEMNDDARGEVYAEAKMLQDLAHTTIIKYYDSFTENGELVIVLELAAFGDLSTLVSRVRHSKQPRLEEHQVWAVFFQVSDALHHMHRHRIMHRDIKPENIFVCQRGIVKLGDLGLGRHFSSNTYKAHSVVGTPFYMSPEVILDSGGYSFKSDIWSMGCVLYELCTLRCPFAGPGLNYYMLGNKISRAEYPSLPAGSSPRVASLCNDIIRVDQDARPDISTVWTLSRRHLVSCLSEHTGEAAIAEDSDDPRTIGHCLAQAAMVVQELLSGPVSPPRSTVPRPSAGKFSQTQVQPPPGPRPEKTRGGYISLDNRRHSPVDAAAPPGPSPQVPVPSGALAPLRTGAGHSRSEEIIKPPSSGWADGVKPPSSAPGRARSPRTLVPIPRGSVPSGVSPVRPRNASPRCSSRGASRERGLGSSKSTPARASSIGVHPVPPESEAIKAGRKSLGPLRAPSPRKTRLSEQGVLLTPREAGPKGCSSCNNGCFSCQQGHCRRLRRRQTSSKGSASGRSDVSNANL